MSALNTVASLWNNEKPDHSGWTEETPLLRSTRADRVQSYIVRTELWATLGGGGRGGGGRDSEQMMGEKKPWAGVLCRLWTLGINPVSHWESNTLATRLSCPCVQSDRGVCTVSPGMCKEGYHGLRCDQFVPKTDAILSDPKSAETYQRQMLSILSISLGICLLAVACMALYRRNKGHREKLRSQFSESRSLRDCSIAPPGMLSKSSPRLQYGLQHQKGSHPRTSVVKGSGGAVPVSPSPLASPALARALAKAKRFRSSSLSISPAQERRGGTYCQTPPTSRGKCGLLDGARVTGRAYSHLDEAEVMDREAESLRRCVSAGLRVGGLLGRTSLSHFSSRRGWAEVPCTRLDKGNAFLPASLRTRSVPIIPSLQAHQPEEKGDVLDDSQPNVVVLVTPRGPFTPCETVVAATNGIPTTSSVQTPIVSMTMPGSVRNALSSPTLAAVTGSKHKTLPGPPAVVPWSQGQIYAASDATGCGRPRPLRTGRAPGLARLRGEDGLASQGRASWEHRAAGHGSATGGSRGDVGSGPHAS
ncbi:Pro-neuregulin-3, membrane-bound isoform [Merluccius polli]|uniref:Pro-neuregulin-3, membrane-bound isoform n=1 Tax=Merluccius polli TaxID=89951 RepID=A0AA47MAS9_MERPO|nr:Pro-neuregulin-3, membrane-bound isoform [Merluccius polli]